VTNTFTTLFRGNSEASLVGQLVKNPPANAGMQETWFQSPSQEDPLEKEMGTLPSTLIWKFPWTEETSGLQSMGLQTLA